MHNHNNTANVELELATAPSEPIGALPWHAEVGQILTRAAKLCVEHDIDLDAFMRGAWSAYVEARPGMRDYLEEIQLRDQLDEIRKHGQMGQA